MIDKVREFSTSMWIAPSPANGWRTRANGKRKRGDVMACYRTLNTIAQPVFLIVGCLTFGLGPASAGNAELPPAAASLQEAHATCAELVGKTFGQAHVVKANMVANHDEGAQYCSVVAQHAERSDFEMQALLPVRWSGDYLHFGGGGFDGSLSKLPFWGPYAPIERNMVVVTSNGGHKGDARSIYNSPDARLDYAYRAIGISDDFANALLASYYHEKPKYRYFAGCSKGGYDALVAAARYGDQYDGVLAQAPAPRVYSWAARVGSYAKLPPVSPETWARIYHEFLKQCDGQDGLKDGVASDLSCRFDPSAVPNLTKDELKTVRSVTSDLQTPSGEIIYRGFNWGNQEFFFGPMQNLGSQWVSLMLMSDPSYDPATFDIAKDWPKFLKLNEVYEMNIPERRLVPFLKSGKKILIVMGSDDPTESVRDNVNFYENVSKAAGSSRTNIAMYMLPGVGHCGYGQDKVNGPSSVDMLGALQAWTTKNHAPDDMIASKEGGDDKVVTSRPVCRAGFYPRYDGRGDPNASTSFSCAKEGRTQ